MGCRALIHFAEIGVSPILETLVVYLRTDPVVARHEPQPRKGGGATADIILVSTASGNRT